MPDLRFSWYSTVHQPSLLFLNEVHRSQVFWLSHILLLFILTTKTSVYLTFKNKTHLAFLLFSLQLWFESDQGTSDYVLPYFKNCNFMCIQFYVCFSAPLTKCTKSTQNAVSKRSIKRTKAHN